MAADPYADFRAYSERMRQYNDEDFVEEGTEPLGPEDYVTVTGVFPEEVWKPFLAKFMKQPTQPECAPE
jgi:hypothetical protein